MAPAGAPTKRSTFRRSSPACSSMPERTPDSHASPTTPPAPRTRTSGGVKDRLGGTDARLGRPHGPDATDTHVCDNVRSMSVAVGSRVRALRESSRLSLRELAVRSGVSAPMLSQVERGETSPTLQVAERIAGGLELRLSQLLRLDEGAVFSVVRAGEGRAGGADGHRYEVLSPPLPGQRAELSRHVLNAGARTGGAGDPPMHQPGARGPGAPPRRCTSPARARPRSSSRARSSCTATPRPSRSARATSSPSTRI